MRAILNVYMVLDLLHLIAPAVAYVAASVVLRRKAMVKKKKLTMTASVKKQTKKMHQVHKAVAELGKAIIISLYLYYTHFSYVSKAIELLTNSTETIPVHTFAVESVDSLKETNLIL